MSVYTSYYAFSEKKADKEWVRFNELARRLGKDYEKLEELKRTNYPGDLIDEELYNRNLLRRKGLMRKRTAKLGDVARKIEKIKTINPLLETGIEYYIRNQEPIEGDIALAIMVFTDLSFGGGRFSVNEGDSYYINKLLKIAFPDLDIDESKGSYGITEEAWIHIFDNRNSIKARLKKRKKEISIDIDTEEMSEARKELFEFLEGIEPIIKTCRENGVRLVLITEEKVEDKDLLKRAKQHIADLKGLPIMKSVFGNQRI